MFSESSSLKYLIIIFSLIGLNTFACEGESSMSNNDIQSWLGKNSEFSKTLNKSVEEITKKMISSVPANRFGDAAEVADAIAFLCSPSAGYINGINLPVDGGRTTSL